MLELLVAVVRLLVPKRFSRHLAFHSRDAGCIEKSSLDIGRSAKPRAHATAADAAGVDGLWTGWTAQKR